MKKFSELGVTVQDERKMFNCSQVSISDVLKIPKDAFPFSTTIKGMKCGNGKIYQFT